MPKLGGNHDAVHPLDDHVSMLDALQGNSPQSYSGFQKTTKDPLVIFSRKRADDLVDMTKGFLGKISRSSCFFSYLVRRLMWAVRKLQRAVKQYLARRNTMLLRALKQWEHRENRMAQERNLPLPHRGRRGSTSSPFGQQAPAIRPKRYNLTAEDMFQDYLHTGVEYPKKIDALKKLYWERRAHWYRYVYTPWKKNMKLQQQALALALTLPSADAAKANLASHRQEPIFTFTVQEHDVVKMITTIASSEKRRSSFRVSETMKESKGETTHHLGYSVTSIGTVTLQHPIDADECTSRQDSNITIVTESPEETPTVPKPCLWNITAEPAVAEYTADGEVKSPKIVTDGLRRQDDNTNNNKGGLSPSLRERQSSRTVTPGTARTTTARRASTTTTCSIRSYRRPSRVAATPKLTGDQQQRHVALEISVVDSPQEPGKSGGGTISLPPRVAQGKKAQKEESSSPQPVQPSQLPVTPIWIRPQHNKPQSAAPSAMKGLTTEDTKSLLGSKSFTPIMQQPPQERDQPTVNVQRPDPISNTDVASPSRDAEFVSPVPSSIRGTEVHTPNTINSIEKILATLENEQRQHFQETPVGSLTNFHFPPPGARIMEDSASGLWTPASRSYDVSQSPTTGTEQTLHHVWLSGNPANKPPPPNGSPLTINCHPNNEPNSDSPNSKTVHVYRHQHSITSPPSKNRTQIDYTPSILQREGRLPAIATKFGSMIVKPTGLQFKHETKLPHTPVFAKKPTKRIFVIDDSTETTTMSTEQLDDSKTEVSATTVESGLSFLYHDMKAKEKGAKNVAPRKKKKPQKAGAARCEQTTTATSSTTLPGGDNNKARPIYSVGGADEQSSTVRPLADAKTEHVVLALSPSPDAPNTYLSKSFQPIVPTTPENGTDEFVGGIRLERLCCFTPDEVDEIYGSLMGAPGGDHNDSDDSSLDCYEYTAEEADAFTVLHRMASKKEAERDWRHQLECTPEPKEVHAPEQEPETAEDKPPSGVFVPTPKAPLQSTLNNRIHRGASPTSMSPDINHQDKNAALNKFPLRSQLPPILGDSLEGPLTGNNTKEGGFTTATGIPPSKPIVHINRNPLRVNAYPNSLVPDAVSKSQRERWEQENIHAVHNQLVQFVKFQRQGRLKIINSGKVPPQLLPVNATTTNNPPNASRTELSYADRPHSPKPPTAARPQVTGRNNHQRVDTKPSKLHRSNSNASQPQKQAHIKGNSNTSNHMNTVAVKFAQGKSCSSTNANSNNNNVNIISKQLTKLPKQLDKDKKLHGIPMHQYKDTLDVVSRSLVSIAGDPANRPPQGEGKASGSHQPKSTMAMSTFILMREQHIKQKEMRRAEKKVQQACKYLNLGKK